MIVDLEVKYCATDLDEVFHCARNAGLNAKSSREVCRCWDVLQIWQDWFHEEFGEFKSIRHRSPPDDPPDLELVFSEQTVAFEDKNNDYEFEKEVRIITDAQIPECGRVLNDVSANQLIQQIVLSPWIELDEFEALQQRLQPLCPDAQITRSPLIKNLDDEKTVRAINRLMPG